VQSTRLADPFEPLNSSLAQWAEELGRWWGNRKLLFFLRKSPKPGSSKSVKGKEKGLTSPDELINPVNKWFSKWSISTPRDQLDYPKGW